MKRILRRIFQLAALLLVAGALAAGTRFALKALEAERELREEAKKQGGPGIWPADEIPPIKRTAPGGTVYTVDNRPAVFDLDMRRGDRHSDTLFPSFAAAGAYARDQGLDVLPSVQLIQAKCQRVDQRIVTAVETAIQAGTLAPGRPGRQELLARLLKGLLAIHADPEKAKFRPAAAAAGDKTRVNHGWHG